MHARNENSAKTSMFHQLVPFTERDAGIIKMRGRIDRASLTEVQRYSIILQGSQKLHRN